MKFKIRIKKPNHNLALAAKILHLICSMLFTVVGIFMLFPQVLDLRSEYIFASISCIIIGAVGMFGYFSNDMYRLVFQGDFALGIFHMLMGGMLLIRPNDFAMLLPLAVGIVALLDGGYKAQIGLEGFRFGLKAWFLVVISAALECIAGIAILYLDMKTVDTHVLIAWTLITIGIVNFWTTMYMVRIKGARKEYEKD